MFALSNTNTPLPQTSEPSELDRSNRMTSAIGNEDDARCVDGSSASLILVDDDGDMDEASSIHNSATLDEDCSTNGSGGVMRGDAIRAINDNTAFAGWGSSAGGDSGSVSSPCSRSLKSNVDSVHDEFHSNDDNSFYSDDADDDMSLGFPPGHITHMAELHILQNHNQHSTETKVSVNPSIIPSYFFCPLTGSIMKDPVITPDGNTYERRAILRSLILEDCDPISRTPLSHEELTEDQLVRQAIHKARAEAWTRYAIEFKGEDTNAAHTNITAESYHDVLQFCPQQEVISNNLSQDLSSTNSSLVDRSSSFSSSSFVDDSASVNHGWSVPLGVHKVLCSQPGLAVTTDSHRRSNVVKRKILLKSLAVKNKKSDAKMIHLKRKKMKNNLKTITTVITRDLIIPPGSYVDILETCVHGGRIRGRIVWEEELTTENDLTLSMRLAELELRKSAATTTRAVKLSNSPGKNIRTFFHKKSHNNDEHSADKMSSMMHEDGHLRSLSPVTTNTIEYTGWISLQWDGSSTNYERDEALRQRESNSYNYQATSFLAADDDEGPWSQPLPLGVYRVCGDSSMDDTYAGNHDVGRTARQLPLYDAPDCKNVIDYLVPNQCIEVVETKVLLMKTTNDQNKPDAGKQVVRARCMIATVENRHEAAPPQRKFRQGWITMTGHGKESVSVSPIALGAYIVTAHDPIESYDANSLVKSLLPSGSVRQYLMVYHTVTLSHFFAMESKQQ